MTLSPRSVNGDDFMVNDPAIVTFDEGAGDGSSKCINIFVLNDDDFENDHSFQAQLMAISPSDKPMFLDTTLATILIQDNDGKICNSDVNNYSLHI